MKPQISVIVPTLNREQVLCDTLDYLLKEKDVVFELLVIDQTKKHDQETDKFLSRIADKIRYFRIEPKGLPNARNFSLKKALAPIVLFLDDDIIPKADLIKTHLKNYNDPKIAGVSGRVKQESAYPNYSFYNKFTSYGKYLFNLDYNKRTEAVGFSGANHSFRKEWTDKVGPYDEGLIINGMFEDVDMGFRIHKKGGKIIYDPKAEVFHLLTKTGGYRKDFETEARWYYGYFYGYTYFFAKHFNQIYLPLFLMQKRMLGVFVTCIGKGLLRWHKPFLGFSIFFKGVRDGRKNAKKFV